MSDLLKVKDIERITDFLTTYGLSMGDIKLIFINNPRIVNVNLEYITIVLEELEKLMGSKYGAIETLLEYSYLVNIDKEKISAELVKRSVMQIQFLQRNKQEIQ